MDESSNAERWWIALLFLALGTSGLGWAAAQSLGAARGARTVAYWATDRGAHEVVGLDANLIEVRRVGVASPTEIEPGRAGTWVASARDSDPLGVHDLIRMGPDGTPLARATLAAVVDLATLDGHDALVVEWALPRGARDSVLRVDPSGLPRTLVQGVGLVCVAGRGDRLVVGSESGEVWLHSATSPGAPLAHRFLGVEVTDLAPGPAAGWWALEAGGSSRLFLLGPRLETRWAAPTGLRALHLVPAPGQERVWLADSTAPLARRYGAGGVLELEVPDLPLSGLDRGLGRADGGVLLCAPGAILNVDSDGALLPGQGGFHFLVDLASAR